jgi:hypothetical protein
MSPKDKTLPALNWRVENVIDEKSPYDSQCQNRLVTGKPSAIRKLNCYLASQLLLPARLCYSFPPHGDTPSESAAGTEPGFALLPELCPRSKRSADLRRLFRHHLPPLRHAARVS